MRERPNYAAVGAFYGMALGWVSLVGLALWAAGAGKLSFGAAVLAQYSVAFLYMPAPMVAALIVERRLGAGYAMRRVFEGFGRSWPRILLVSTLTVLGGFAFMAAEVAVLGNVLGLPGVGRFVTTPGELLRNIAELLGPQAAAQMAGQQMPSPLLLIAVAGPAGLVAGFTLNGLFAFGEEYAWRGWLMDELAPLGPVRANLLTGVLWGVWHAPLILMGFNYGPHRVLGIVFMCGLTTAMSFLFWRAREYTGSILAPCVLHGAFNGFQGFLVLTIAQRNELVSVSAGVLGWLALAIATVPLWVLSRNRLLAPANAAATALETPAPSAGPGGDTIPPA